MPVHIAPKNVRFRNRCAMAGVPVAKSWTMAAIEEFVDFLKNNRPKILRYVFVLQVLVGVFLLFMADHMGRTNFHLIRVGVRAPGRVVGNEQRNFGSSVGHSGMVTTAFMPIVEFSANGQKIRFTDWLGSSSTGSFPDRVTVLYDAAAPSVAIIDRPLMNWLPWAPIGAVGCFLCLVGLKGLLVNPQSGEREAALR